MSDPTLSDIDFKNKMAWVGTTLKFSLLIRSENPVKTVFVMNTEGLHLAGVSGGVSLELKSDHRNTEYLICTFSNPLVGCVKAAVFLSSEGGIDQIDALWEPMDQCSLEKGTFYGIYRESDKHITFVWKDQKTPW